MNCFSKVSDSCQFAAQQTAQSCVEREPRYLTAGELAAELGYSRGHLYHLQKAGVLPPPVYLRDSRRPVYHPAQLGQCQRILASRVGLNGKPVMLRKQSRPVKGQIKLLQRKLQHLGFPVEIEQLQQELLQITGSNQCEPEMLRQMIRQQHSSPRLRSTGRSRTSPVPSGAVTLCEHTQNKELERCY